MINQAAHTVLMIRPKAFGFNEETSSSNVFQQQIDGADVKKAALKEFDRACKELKSAGIEVVIFEDSDHPITPDAVFPNNWFIAQPDGKVVICPMASSIRRSERRDDIIEFLRNNYDVSEVFDYSSKESDEQYLEGTGSIIFDHIHKKAYACPSERTDENLFKELCEELGYKPILFLSRDENGNPIYHTNVMLCIGTELAIVCLDAIHPADHEILLENFAEDDIKIIAISFKQMRAMAGNVLEVQTKNGYNALVMSQTAYDSLLTGQLDAITRKTDIAIVNIPTIEKVGGGGIRCMMAGIHLPQKS